MNIQLILLFIMIRQHLKLNSSKLITFHAHKQRKIKVMKHNLRIEPGHLICIPTINNNTIVEFAASFLLF